MASKGFRPPCPTPDVVGRDLAGRTIIQLPVDDWTLEKLMTFDAEAADLELEPDDEEDGPPVVLELAGPTVVGAGGAYLRRQAGSTEPYGT